MHRTPPGGHAAPVTTTSSYTAAHAAEATTVERLRADFTTALRTAALPDPVRVYLHVLAQAATATNRGHLIKAPVPGGTEAATGFSVDLFERVNDIALATGWLRLDDSVRYQVLLVDVPRWTAQMMDLGVYDDEDDPEWHGRPVEPYADIDIYRARIGDLATS